MNEKSKFIKQYTQKGYFVAAVSDLDGTLVSNGFQDISHIYIRETISHILKHMRICIATGRPWAGAKKVIKGMGIKDLCVVGAGSVIISPKDERIVWESALSKLQLESVLKVLQPFPYEILFNEQKIGQGEKATDIIIPEFVNVIYVMSVPKSYVAELSKKINDLPGINCNSVIAWNGLAYDLHVTHSDANKESSINRIWRIYDIDPMATIGFGDSLNDLGIFEAVGWRVAVDNADSALLKKCDDTCDSVKKNGVLNYLKGILKS